MMYRLLVAALLILVIAAPAAGQGVPAGKVAVVDFEADEKLLGDSVLLSRRLVRSLSVQRGCETVSREDVWKEMLKLGDEGAKYFEKPDAAAKLGNALGAGTVVTGRLDKAGATYVLIVRAVNVSTGKFVSEHREEHTGYITDALGLADILALKVTGSYDGPVITTDSFPEGRVGKPYAEKLAAAVPGKDKDKDKVIEWSVVDGALPDGLRVESDAITGTPEKPGVFRFTIRAGIETPRLRGGPEKILQIKVKPAPLTLPDMELPVGRLGHPYSVVPKPPTGTPPFTWEKLEGPLPPGVSFNTAAGRVEGKPRATGTFKIKVSVTDSLEPPETASGWLTLKVTPAMKITTTGLPEGYAGCEYRAQVGVENGLAPFEVEVLNGAGGLELKGLDKGLGIGGKVGQSATGSRVTVRVSDSTAPEPQVAEMSYMVKVKALCVAPVVSSELLELYDFGLDRGGAPMILAVTNVLGSGRPWVTLCRWSGKEWTILPVTAQIKGGYYRLLSTPEGPPAVIGCTETGNPPRVQLSVFTPSDREWVPQAVAAGRFHFLKARFDPDGGLVFAYERDRGLYTLKRDGGIWKEHPLLDGAIELTEFLYSPSGRAYFLYQDESGVPMLLEKSKTYSNTVKLPAYPHCAGIDPEGNLRVFSHCLGESVCYVRKKDTFEEAGRWKRPVAAGAVFSKRHLAAYSPPPARSGPQDAGEPAIYCISPAYIFGSITFDKEQANLSSWDAGSLRVAVDKRGNVHAAFIAAGAARSRKRVLVYGRIAARSEFRKIARAKSFVRLTGQRELSMPKRGPGINRKSGGCTLAMDGSPAPLAFAVLFLSVFLYRRRRE
jgi:hypothetical protein